MVTSTRTYQSASTARESNEELYIKTCGENQERTIVETWMDVACPLNDRDAEGRLIPAVVEQRKVVQAALEAALEATTTPLQQAEWASMLCGGQGYQDWLDDQE